MEIEGGEMRLRRSYLSSEEENNFMMLAALSISMSSKSERGNYIELLEKRGMLTKETRKEFKMFYTYLNKYLKDTYSMLDETTQKRLIKRLRKFDFKIIDDYQLQRVMREANEKLKDVVLTRETFEDLIEDITEVRCKNCTKDYQSCEIYKALYEALLDAPGFAPNCPYAWREE